MKKDEFEIITAMVIIVMIAWSIVIYIKPIAVTIAGAVIYLAAYLVTLYFYLKK